MDTEKLAVSAVVDSISQTDILSPFINDDDKEPSWDGNIYIYEDRRKKKQGIRRVPVQIKGKQKKRISQRKQQKFSVSIIDLNNWLNDGGIILFVVFIDESGKNKKIYYSALLPVLIRNLMKDATNKKKLNVPLRPFPLDNNKKVEVLLNFYNDMKKQTSFANAPLLTAEELSKEGVLEEIHSIIFAYGDSEDSLSIESALFHNDIYLYASVKGSSIPQPLPEMPRNIHVKKDISAIVMVKDKKFYSECKIDKYAEGINIYIGKGIVMSINYESGGNTINFKANGYLSDYIDDTEFIIAIIENRELTINGRTIKLDPVEDTVIEECKNNLKYYRDVRKMLEMMGAQGDLNCDILSEQDDKNIRNFTNAMVYGKEIGFSDKTNDVIYGRFKIANLVLLIWANKTSENGYRLQSFFSNKIMITVRSNNEEDEHQITHYAMLKKNDFIDASNIDYGKIVADLSQNDVSPVVMNQITLFMLEMIKAYDEMDKKNSDLYQTVERYCEWLKNNTKVESDIMTLNRLQVIRRQRDFDNDEVQLLRELINENHDEQVRCGANILLGEMESAQECFDKMDAKCKDIFIEYPICYFGKLQYKKMEDGKNG